MRVSSRTQVVSHGFAALRTLPGRVVCRGLTTLTALTRHHPPRGPAHRPGRHEQALTSLLVQGINALQPPSAAPGAAARRTPRSRPAGRRRSPADRCGIPPASDRRTKLRPVAALVCHPFARRPRRSHTTERNASSAMIADTWVLDRSMIEIAPGAGIAPASSVAAACGRQATGWRLYTLVDAVTGMTLAWRLMPLQPQERQSKRRWRGAR